MILLIDNYDSFTYNLYQLIGKNTDEAIQVVRNDQVTIDEIIDLNPSHIVISPGPGRPEDAGVTVAVTKELADHFPILGVCLGLQAMCLAYGADIVHAQPAVHGKQSTIHVASGSEIFRGLPPVVPVARYHSLIADRQTLPDELLVIAESDKGEVMAVRHREYPMFGVQFHPESILTPSGETMIQSFLKVGGNTHD